MFNFLKVALAKGASQLAFKVIDVSLILKLVIGWLMDAYQSKGREGFTRYIFKLGERVAPDRATEDELKELMSAFEGVFFIRTEDKLTFNPALTRLGKAFLNVLG